MLHYVRIKYRYLNIHDSVTTLWLVNINMHYSDILFGKYDVVFYVHNVYVECIVYIG